MQIIDLIDFGAITSVLNKNPMESGFNKHLAEPVDMTSLKQILVEVSQDSAFFL